MKKSLLLTVLCLVVLAGGGIYYFSQNKQQDSRDKVSTSASKDKKTVIKEMIDFSSLGLGGIKVIVNQDGIFASGAKDGGFCVYKKELNSKKWQRIECGQQPDQAALNSLQTAKVPKGLYEGKINKFKDDSPNIKNFNLARMAYNKDGVFASGTKDNGFCVYKKEQDKWAELNCGQTLSPKEEKTLKDNKVPEFLYKNLKF